VVPTADHTARQVRGGLRGIGLLVQDDGIFAVVDRLDRLVGVVGWELLNGDIPDVAVSYRPWGVLTMGLVGYTEGAVRDHATAERPAVAIARAQPGAPGCSGVPGAPGSAGVQQEWNPQLRHVATIAAVVPPLMTLK